MGRPLSLFHLLARLSSGSLSPSLSLWDVAAHPPLDAAGVTRSGWLTWLLQTREQGRKTLDREGKRGMMGREENTLYVGKYWWPNEVMLECFDLGKISNCNKSDELHQNEFAHLCLTLTHFLFCYRQSFALLPTLILTLLTGIWIRNSFISVKCVCHSSQQFSITINNIIKKDKKKS